MPLYTFIMNFKDGVYIKQVNASSAKSACLEWAKNLEISHIEGLGVKGREFLVEEMKNEIPVPIKETINTWCVTTSIRGNLALINFVQTEQF